MKIEVDIARTLGAFTLDVKFAADAAVVALFGRSGAGKTSVVNAITGLLRPARGRIAIDGEVLFDAARGIDLAPEARRVGVVFQDGLLFPHLSVRANLIYGHRAGARIGLEAVVALLGLEALLERRPAGLSGGEKQRVAIGRALLADPRVLLMDEPLASLDNPRRMEVLRHVERARDELKLPVIYVSHSVAEVTRLADHVVLMDAGSVLAQGPVMDIFNRAELRPHTGRFEGGALVEAEAIAHDSANFLTQFRFSGGILVAPGLDAPPGTRVRMRIRSRDVALAITRPQGISIRNILPGTVDALVDRGGAIVEVAVRLGDVLIPARISRQAMLELQLAPGTAVHVLIKAIAFDKRSVGFSG